MGRMVKAVLALTLLAVMAGAWYLALQPPVAPGGHAIPTRASAARDTAVPAVRLSQLAARRTVPPGPGTSERDPFSQGVVRAQRPGVPVAGASVSASAAHAVASTVVPTWPRLELIGVAEVREGAGVVRTAILSGPRGVQHARPGDLLEDVYRLERIVADGVDVRLVPEDRLMRLPLRP